MRRGGEGEGVVGASLLEGEADIRLWESAGDCIRTGTSGVLLGNLLTRANWRAADLTAPQAVPMVFRTTRAAGSIKYRRCCPQGW